MSTKAAFSTMSLLVLLSLASSTGCHMAAGPDIGIMAIPIPISPYLQKTAEDKAWVHERYSRMPILGPITPGAPHTALDPPSDDEVERVLEASRPVQGGWPMLYETQRMNMHIVCEPISDYVDPPRVYPLCGPAQLHHVHYKCIVNFTEVVRVGWPIPYTTTNEDCQEVVYIDHDHFHMVGNMDPGPGSNY